MLCQGRAFHQLFSLQALIISRRNASSWRLLCYLIQMIPLPNAARILSERKFTNILLQTLKEAQETAGDIEADMKETETSYEKKPSKKRKRSGEQVKNSNVPDIRGPNDLLAAIFAAVNCIICSTKTAFVASQEGRSAAFSTEYMRSVIRASAEESAKILGSWLSLTLEILKSWNDQEMIAHSSWVSPFVEIWHAHAAGDVDLVVFSLHCSQPLLSLLRAAKERENSALVAWMTELEHLVARDIIIPARISKEENVDSDLLNTLTRISVLQDPSNAPILFDVAIRSLQPQGTRRRRPQDNSWLQTVFATVMEAMPPHRKIENGEAIGDMLRSAIVHKVVLELLSLRSITSDYALSPGKEDWGLLATVTKLDANVFLIPNAEEDLLQKLLKSITDASIATSWPEISETVVSKVVVPLMDEFAKARDLSGFIHHWHAQLIHFGKLRKSSRPSSKPVFSAWEDDALQLEMSRLLEPSLTTLQIVQLLDWLSSQVVESPDAVCVILEAIAGSVTREETVDTVGLRLYHIMFGNGTSEKLDGRYMWRSWRIISRTLHWIEAPELEEIARLWEERVEPFDSLCGKIRASGLLEVGDAATAGLEILESLRCVCAAWSAAEKGSKLQALVKSAMLDFLQGSARDMKKFPRDLQSQQELGEEICTSSLNTLYRGTGWTLLSFVQCIFVEYPKALE